MGCSPVRIYVVGPSSSGKTTLCNALAEEMCQRGWSFSYTTEMARDVMRKAGFSRAPIGNVEMQEAIIAAYWTREQEIRTVECRAEEVHLFDRCAVDAVVYALLTAEDNEQKEQRWDKLVLTLPFQEMLTTCYRTSSSIIILLRPVAQWIVDDGVRFLEDPTTSLEMFRRVLQRLNLEYQEIGEDMLNIEHRVHFMVQHIGTQ
ncbi:hypothetical protein FISHEDRAFT_33133 [Fistulina hepatica ATCC 64428]|uniref:NadR/Ttd14 AAA domain-containing protein n=1 Tax=Fistulina hepatica ATCC 64428 TaxID=1128425 RepID=A0A0D7ANQ1_9AGAR|nr:hypothetical protein FISHEDRAFT_33133 [Fistulina hepatica ATCC 64428]